MQWARAHQDWLLPQWRNVLFSNESRFGLVSDDYRERVWRRECKTSIILSFNHDVMKSFIFMDDNARPHRTRAVQTSLGKRSIARLEWPAMSLK
nr:unnamed protein product [Callosobruchus chinensis]